MKKKLEQLAEIKSGYLFKESIRPERDGNVRVVQLKDINPRGVLDIQGIQAVNLEKPNSNDLLSAGDVLFKAKTNHPVATVIESVSGKMLATAHYFVIRLKTGEVSPGFLAWYLNQKPAQNYFDRNAGGSRIQVINKQTLGALEIVLPDIEIQKRIENVHALHQREMDLIELIKEKRHLMLSKKMMSKVSE